MSNFIVGQITPKMLQKITFGTFIFFGALTLGGAGFIWLGVPETKRLTLEEMDVLFGSVGVAEAVSWINLFSLLFFLSLCMGLLTLFYSLVGCTPYGGYQQRNWS